MDISAGSCYVVIQQMNVFEKTMEERLAPKTKAKQLTPNPVPSNL